ncbi:Insulin-like growth factor binding protein, N-terminal [Pseudocohnilembus persalinus]|uniref:Insulin-like growth factor binding protein, N-terminal n=1 Tax=Pseudocohnilembus persalinus TaxID=266149 RepID=A0A0V0QSG9_PSEPJ|nr:Insulin-like growth factor binding protein, N-terminal [Pseudocohnilembus persalinus]|eukprot:KRX05250.1 Insulin-like growth factor binding protein, N-terminal [Pseudocohnilembus persalinus]
MNINLKIGNLVLIIIIIKQILSSLLEVDQIKSGVDLDIISIYNITIKSDYNRYYRLAIPLDDYKQGILFKNQTGYTSFAVHQFGNVIQGPIVLNEEIKDSYELNFCKFNDLIVILISSSNQKKQFLQIINQQGETIIPLTELYESNKMVTYSRCIQANEEQISITFINNSVTFAFGKKLSIILKLIYMRLNHYIFKKDIMYTTYNVSAEQQSETIMVPENYFGSQLYPTFNYLNDELIILIWTEETYQPNKKGLAYVLINRSDAQIVSKNYFLPYPQQLIDDYGIYILDRPEFKVLNDGGLFIVSQNSTLQIFIKYDEIFQIECLIVQNKTGVVEGRPQIIYYDNKLHILNVRRLIVMDVIIKMNALYVKVVTHFKGKQACPAQCLGCLNSNYCLKCVDEDMLLPLCLYKKQNYMLTETNEGFIYEKCQKACDGCEDTPDNCLACKGINRGKIPNCQCNKGYHDLFGNLESCVECPALCTECISNEICSKCKPNLNRYLNVFNGKCECLQGYTEVDNQQYCIVCFQLNDACVLKCPENFIQNEEDMVCVPIEYELESNTAIFNFPSAYSQFCKKNPLFTITISGSIIISCGDILCQYISYKTENNYHIYNNQQNTTQGISQQSQTGFQQNITELENYKQNNKFKPNFQRTKEMMIYGMLFYGPLNYSWYVRILPKIVPTSAVVTNRETLKKVAWDEAIYGPTIYTVYLYTLTRIQGGSHDQGVAKVKRDWITLMGLDLIIWPGILYGNFRYVPIHLQTLVINFFSVFWSAFMSYVQHKQ